MARKVRRDTGVVTKLKKKLRKVLERSENYENPFAGATNVKFNYTTCMVIAFAILFLAFVLMQGKNA